MHCFDVQKNCGLYIKSIRKFNGTGKVIKNKGISLQTKVLIVKAFSYIYQYAVWM